MAVAEEESFTRAAAKLGTSQSALSHTVRRLETRLGVRLLTRTTRRVALTQAGERLLKTVRPRTRNHLRRSASLTELREKPAGTIRVTTSEHAAQTVLWPVLNRLLFDYPDIHVELSTDSSLTDIVAERFDAGVRLGELIAKDMVAVRIGPDLRMAVVGASLRFREAAETARPSGPRQASLHQPSAAHDGGGLYAWEFTKKGRELKVRVDGQLVFTSVPMIVRAAMDGYGLAFVLEDQVAASLADGALVRVLEDWCPPFSGYHLYYPSRRQPSAAFTLLVEALRYRPAA